MLPTIKQNESSFESIQMYCRRAEARAVALLADFSKFSMRLSKQTNSFAFNASSTRDIGYWETELTRRERDIVNILKLFHTTVVLLLIYPNPIPGQEGEEIVQYIEPDHTGQFPDPLTFVSPELQTTFTPQQIAATRRHLSILNDISIDFYRNKELCQSSLNRMQLLAPKRDQADDNDDEDDEYDDGDMSGTDIEAQLINPEGKKKGKGKKQRGGDTNMAALNAESTLIQDSLQQSQFAINNALASQASLGRQRDIFQNVLSRVSALTSTRLPGITNTLGAIQTRQHRDNCILATLIAFCVFITLIYLSWKHR